MTTQEEAVAAVTQHLTDMRTNLSDAVAVADLSDAVALYMAARVALGGLDYLLNSPRSPLRELARGAQ